MIGFSEMTSGSPVNFLYSTNHHIPKHLSVPINRVQSKNVVPLINTQNSTPFIVFLTWYSLTVITEFNITRNDLFEVLTAFSFPISKFLEIRFPGNETTIKPNYLWNALNASAFPPPDVPNLLQMPQFVQTAARFKWKSSRHSALRLEINKIPSRSRVNLCNFPS